MAYQTGALDAAEGLDKLTRAIGVTSAVVMGTAKIARGIIQKRAFDAQKEHEALQRRGETFKQHNPARVDGHRRISENCSRYELGY